MPRACHNCYIGIWMSPVCIGMTSLSLVSDQMAAELLPDVGTQWKPPLPIRDDVFSNAWLAVKQSSLTLPQLVSAVEMNTALWNFNPFSSNSHHLLASFPMPLTTLVCRYFLQTCHVMCYRLKFMLIYLSVMKEGFGYKWSWIICSN